MLWFALRIALAAPAVTATHDLPAGVPLSEVDLLVVDLPEAMVAPDAFATTSDLVGRVPAERILAAEVVRAARLADAAQGRGLNVVVPAGMRAITIPFEDPDRTGVQLVPGARVTVVGGTREGAAWRDVHTVLQTAEVLAVPSPGYVTLAVTAAHAERIATAQATGQLVVVVPTEVGVGR
ncbi:MAG: Flp pilus assembly protein CpaB [Alphaproteobacteria bacterium]|nr:Flp pilus assembly protein CpaB [Alphaproteobacteria bacterium]MCB9696223.1 Flp pilus assembly protein CpaB [Alphaproteobacteria bacterium]